VVYSRTVSGEAIVGYLAISIPFIAWAALKRMENLGTALVGGLSGLQAAVSGSSASSAIGNQSLGNVSMDQVQLAPNRSSAFMGHWQNDLSGNTFSSNALSGRTAVSLLRNQGFASRVVSMRVSEQDVQDASRQVDSARSEAVAASQERSTVLADAFSKGVAKLQASRSSGGSTSSSYEQLGESFDQLDQLSRTISNATGLNQAQVARIALGASGHLGMSTRIAGLQANANVDKAFSSGLSSAEHKALASMSSEQIAAFRQFGDRVTRDTSFVQVISRDAREAQELSARLSASSARSERADATLAERTAFAERVAVAHERGDAIAIDIAQDPHNLRMFTRYAEQYGGGSASAHVLMAAELARQSLKPNRVFSDGTALPTSFETAASQHARHLNDTTLSPDLAGRHEDDRVRVARVGTARDTLATGSRNNGLKDEIRQEAARIRGEVSGDGHRFDAKAAPGQTASANLAAGQSLMKRTVDQVKEDAAPLVDDAKQAVRDALKRP
jgi:conjugal transfer mating pair stabilization protein TraG